MEAAKTAMLESEHRRQQNRHDQNPMATDIINKISQKMNALDEKADRILQELQEFRMNQ